MSLQRFLLAALAAAVVCRILAVLPASAQTVRPIAFPVDGTVTFQDDFGDARSGHMHEGNDLIGKKMTPLVSAIDGFVKHLVIPEASWGYEITLVDNEGWEYNYIHVNNDTPGTDDGNGGPEHAYAPDILAAYRQQGCDGGWHCPGSMVPVTKGQLVGWMGDSGNAENVGAHLHFEIRMPDGTAIDPYQSLLAASLAGTFSPSAARAAATDINADRKLIASPNAACESGSRIKIALSKAVYYCGADGKRYVFPNDKTYYTWYANFSGVTTVSDATLASIPLGGNVTYRPGVKMVKIQSDPKVYAVDAGGTLRWVQSPDVAAALYGQDWSKLVEDVSDAFFINYKVGDPITRAQ